MATTYNKPYLFLPQQLGLIKRRGLHVDNDKTAIECLHRNGYYRLSAYWYPFREIVAGKRSDTFLSGSRFQDAVDLYNFDKRFKLLLLDALERVEIAVRVAISLQLGQRNTFAHTDPNIFRSNFTALDNSGESIYKRWIEKFDKQVAQSNDEFILHYEKQYGSRSPLPIWIAIELWDFGLLSYAFSGMKNNDQSWVAYKFQIPNNTLMVSWLKTLNYVRNVIAHHGRLWNKDLTISPKLPRSGEMPDFNDLLPLPAVNTRIYSVCCILSYFTRVVNPQSTWIKEMKTLINDFPLMPYATIQDMGFPADWQTHGFWK